MTRARKKQRPTSQDPPDGDLKFKTYNRKYERWGLDVRCLQTFEIQERDACQRCQCPRFVTPIEMSTYGINRAEVLAGGVIKDFTTAAIASTEGCYAYDSNVLPGWKNQRLVYPIARPIPYVYLVAFEAHSYMEGDPSDTDSHEPRATMVDEVRSHPMIYDTSFF
ncbi:hypothetical protein Tco_0625790 [Tanacetum coccineum]|uniref:Uncharacterized protein n=1 Tax=Tanacetum coccineum TaxID=301880 RepID=A0ABQ4WHT4_9ASTR